MPKIRVIKPGLQTTIQDAGRFGYEHLGVMISGWLDDYAARWANRLIGNMQDAAVLEITLLGPELVAEDAGWAALAGADLGASVNGRAWVPGTSQMLRTADRVRFAGIRRGARAYLAFPGGVLGDEVLGSRSTDVVARFGGLQGRALKAGDIVEYSGGQARPLQAPVETCLARSVVRVLPGVRVHRFPPDALKRLVSSRFRVSPHSDRVGIRLIGPDVADAMRASDGPSEGMAVGAVEVTAGGELLILLKSRGSIGGYPTLAHVIRADWPVLAQLKPGDEIGFSLVNVEEARTALEKLETSLQSPLIPSDAQRE
ncbi:MAG: urea amidolyase [Sulfobacillus acidophilus]|uniref:Urea amidolyase n=1 Tax=Sulfobacillus acidophilus TaxID=53633 RepID=A0A2T2WLP9_9FIRM|nr:MAG: urea amidolyase [Sulfobacillus acidophilus]